MQFATEIIFLFGRPIPWQGPKSTVQPVLGSLSNVESRVDIDGHRNTAVAKLRDG